jgi:tellurite resistance protein
MANHEKLYEAFGELLYVVAMADGIIQEEEITALEKVLENHPWAADIQWSFHYERKKERSVDLVYARVLDFCKHNGPHPEYQNMIEVMEAVAVASNGVDQAEKAQMSDFTTQLIQRFQHDLETIQS